jgi:hypothetical protein
MRQLTVLDIEPMIDPVSSILAALGIKEKELNKDPFAVCKWFGWALERWEKKFMKDFGEENNVFSRYREYTNYDGTMLKTLNIRDLYLGELVK